MAAACLCWGIDNNLTRKLSSADNVVIAMTKGLAAGLVNGALALLSGAHVPGPAIKGSAVLLGLFGVGISLVFFIRALRHLGPRGRGPIARWLRSSALPSPSSSSGSRSR